MNKEQLIRAKALGLMTERKIALANLRREAAAVALAFEEFTRALKIQIEELIPFLKKLKPKK